MAGLLAAGYDVATAAKHLGVSRATGFRIKDKIKSSLLSAGYGGAN